MSAQHYFSPAPDAPLERRELSVTLRGHEVTVSSAGSVFSPEHVDRGTGVLLSRVPAPPATGTALDLGTGWGPMALALALESPELTVWAVDVNERALMLTAENAKRLRLPNVHAAVPDAVPAEVSFDVIWSNPPIRIGKEALHDLLRSWLPRLAPGGEAWLVVAKKLGGDSLHQWIASTFGPELSIARHATEAGFRLLRVERAQQEPV